MSRIRGWMTLACAASLIVACNKSGGGGSGGTSVAPGAPVVQAGPIDLIPKDASVVLVVNWSKFKGTKFHNLLVGAIPASSKADLDIIKQACNFDVLSGIDSLTVGVIGNLDKTARTVTVAKGDWTRDKIKSCAPAVAEKKGKKMTVTDEGDISSYAIEGQKTVSIGWAGDLMVMTSQSLEGDKTFLSDVLKKSSSVKSNATMSDLLKKTDSAGTLYFAVVPTPGSEMADSFCNDTAATEKM